MAATPASTAASPARAAAALEGDRSALPSTPAQIDAAAREARKLVRKRSLIAAGVAAVPLPALDLITDVGMLMKLIPEINRIFGLTPEQVEKLSPERRVVFFKILSAGSGMLVGRVITRELLVKVLRTVGVRLTTKQATKYVPIAGQAVSAAITYSALRYVCEQHIKQCISVAQQLQQLPPPEEPAKTTVH